MTKVLDLIYKWRWPIVALLIAAFATWLVVVGFGEVLGVDPGVRDVVGRAAQGAWTGLMTLLGVLATRDANGNGTPDALEQVLRAIQRDTETTALATARTEGRVRSIEQKVDLVEQKVERP